MVKVSLKGESSPLEHDTGETFDVRQDGHLFVFTGGGSRLLAVYAPGVWTRAHVAERNA